MKQAESARAEWLRAMHKIAFPVLSAAAENRLHDTLPLDRKEKQRGVAYLEAVGRTMIGIAPWLELSQHIRGRARFAEAIPGFRPQSARQHL